MVPMSHISLTNWLAAVVLPTVLSAVAQDDEVAQKNEMKNLQGTWVVQAATRDGKERGQEMGGVLTISGDSVTMRLPGGKDTLEMVVGVQDLEQLARVLRRLTGVANVMEARRQR